MFKSLMFLTALCSGVVMPVAFETANNQEAINFEYQNKKFVFYDDENYTVTLSADELNNFVWSNLEYASVNGQNFSLMNISITYLDDEYEFFSDSWYGSYKWSNGTDEILFVQELEEINAEYGGDLPHTYMFSFNGGSDSFNSFLVLDGSAESIDAYLEMKQAIELDIQANSGSPMGNVLTEVVSLLVGGIVPFATGIGQGVSDLVSYTFIDNGALSVLGAIIAVFAGIALAVGLSRWVMNFLTSLGAKK